jgi:hypothetical protein
MIEFTDSEIEEDCTRLMEEAPERYGESLDQLRVRFGHPIAYSEVFHPAFMLMETVEHYLMESPCVFFDEQAFRHAHDASTALFNLYQRLGSLRYDAETKPRPALGLTGFVGRWSEVFFALGQSEISDAIKASLARSFLVFAEEDEPGTEPPVLYSFGMMVKFLERYPELPAPSLNVNGAGQFTLCYFNSTERFSLLFKYIIDQAEVTHTVRTDGKIGVESSDQSINSMKFPEWLTNESR